MRSVLMIAIPCLLASAGEPWAEAQATFKAELQPGAQGCLVYLERLDANSVRVRVVAQGTRLQNLEGEPVGYERFVFRGRSAKGSSGIRLVTWVPEASTAVRLRLVSEGFSSEVVLPLPKVGAAEGAVLQAEPPRD